MPKIDLDGIRRSRTPPAILHRSTRRSKDAGIESLDPHQVSLTLELAM